MELIDAIASWGRARPTLAGSLRADAAALGAWHEASAAFVSGLATRDTAGARCLWRDLVRRANGPFVKRHLAAIVEMVRGREPASFMRESCELGEQLTGLVASASELAGDARRRLPEKIGVEYKSALVLSALLAAGDAARLLIDGARQPLPQSTAGLVAFKGKDCAELEGARIRRDGPIAFVELSNPDALNSENDSVREALEVCVDMALLDDRIKLGVIRGAPVRNKKYAGRRVFCSGINLSDLYEGRLPYLYYVKRELGLVSKLYRGLGRGKERPPIEKPWIAVVDTHAIGGGCQLLLVMDYVIAERGSFLSLPAKREGIIPGAANLRLSRFIGDRAARRMIFMDRALPAESAEGRSLIDEVVSSHEIETAIDAAAEAFASSEVGLAGNRKALRIAQEPRSAFRRYMSHFALAQADCHFSEALFRNLERNWMIERAPLGPHPR